MGRLGQIANWAAFTAEVVRGQPHQAPRILAAAINARIRGKLHPDKVTASGLWRQPFSSVGDYVAYWGESELHKTLRLVNWQGEGRRLVEDKLVTAERYVREGIVTLPILAVVGRDEQAHPHDGLFPSLNSELEVASILRNRTDELIVKPAGGSRGGDVQALRRSGERWVLGDEELGLDELARRLLQTPPSEGLLLQPRLRSHAGLEPIGGGFGLSTVRINTAMLRDGPVFLFGFLKIMGQAGVVDNFSGGKRGNLIAAFDVSTGTIVEAFGRRPGHRFLLTEMTHHPATSTPLIGFEIPLWKEALALALRAAASCPETPLVGADVAITDEGPKMVEINAAWDCDYPELFARKGLRSMLRDVWPDLLLADPVKAQGKSMLRLPSSSAPVR